jgi:hypothetical protein
LRKNHQHARPTFPLSVTAIPRAQPARRRRQRASEQTINIATKSPYHTLARAANVSTPGACECAHKSPHFSMAEEHPAR